MTWTAGALNTGKMSIGIRVRERIPRTRIMNTIVATMYGFRSEALISHMTSYLA